MKSPAKALFARPMPYKVSWLRDGRFVSVTSYSRQVAEQVLDEEQARGNDPTMYLGGMVVEDTGKPAGEGVVVGARR